MAKDALEKLYKELQGSLSEENEWLKELFPQLRQESLSRLLQASLGQLKQPSTDRHVTRRINIDGSEHSVQDARALHVRMNELLTCFLFHTIHSERSPGSMLCRQRILLLVQSS